MRGYGRTLAEAFEQAAQALGAAVADLGRISEAAAVDISCEAPDEELLFVDWLNALIYEMTTRRMCFRRFTVAIDGLRLRGRAFGEVMDPAKHDLGVEAKGATYTALRVEHRGDGDWLAQCVIDV